MDIFSREYGVTLIDLETRKFSLHKTLFKYLNVSTYDALYTNRNVSGCRKSTEKWNTTLNVYAVARYTLMSTNPVNLL